jgi:hypothetical protein
MTWLDKTPSAVVAAFSAMIPRLSAHESRTRANEVAIGRGIKPGTWIKKQLQSWEKDARGGGSLVKKAPGRGELAAAGIGLKVVKRG